MAASLSPWLIVAINLDSRPSLINGLPVPVCLMPATHMPAGCQSPASRPPVSRQSLSRSPAVHHPPASQQPLARCSPIALLTLTGCSCAPLPLVMQMRSSRSPDARLPPSQPRARRVPAARLPLARHFPAACQPHALPAACLAGCMSAALTRRSPAVCQLLAGPLPAARLPLAGYLPLASRYLTSRCLTSRSSRCQPLACQQWLPSQISHRPGPALSKQPSLCCRPGVAPSPLAAGVPGSIPAWSPSPLPLPHPPM